MTEGLTTTGLVIDTTDQTLTKIESDELATIDAALDTSPEEPLGQVNGIYASDRSLVAQLVQAVYSALDPNNAEGQQLDLCCALTGTKRKGPTSTEVAMTGTATPSTTFTGATLDANGNVVTPGQIQMQIAGHPEFVFTNRSTFTSSPSGAIPSPLGGDVLFICTRTGPIPCNAGTLTVISPSVPGLTSLTNPADGALGSDIESDAALRLRRVVELVPPDGGTYNSLLDSLLAVKGTGPGFQGVISAQLLVNDTDATDVNGAPPHSFQAVVWDGASPQATNNAIAQAIWDAKPAGVRSYDGGSGLFGTAIDSAGASHSVPFSRATQDVLYVAITVAIDSTLYPTNGDTQLAALLVAFGNALKTGATVVVEAFKSQAFAIAGVKDVTVFKVDTAVTPVNTANIVTLPTHIPRFDTARVTVSHA